MPAEFSGGTPDVAFDAHSDDEPAHAVQVEQFDFNSLDSLADLIRDCEVTGEQPWNVVREIFRDDIDALVLEGIRTYRDILAPSSRRKMAEAQLEWAIGESLVHDTKSLSELARRFGVSKQAFVQGAEQYRELLGIRAQTKRTDDAKRRMSRNNIRHSKSRNTRAFAKMFDR